MSPQALIRHLTAEHPNFGWWPGPQHRPPGGDGRKKATSAFETRMTGTKAKYSTPIPTTTSMPTANAQNQTNTTRKHVEAQEPKLNAGLIMAPILGVLLPLAAFIILFVVCHRRKTRNQTPPSVAVQPQVQRIGNKLLRERELAAGWWKARMPRSVRESTGPLLSK
ncbi:hypothetical protein CPB83DRAFT_384088 [Crepidotus variabilis]|uniref:Uncharacterized protein n=1 Tax=Crepidotus variabilis TaxID=179855 RepID=A0A9P6EEJ8_9AGAR|nr:hypothetical protein CPB83DRAFT_384088 [Crepidotus variabilis]